MQSWDDIKGLDRKSPSDYERRDRQTDKQTEFPLVDSIPPVEGVVWKPVCVGQVFSRNPGHWSCGVDVVSTNQETAESQVALLLFAVVQENWHKSSVEFLAPSGALVFIMVYYIPAAPTFSNFSNLKQSCLYTFIIHFHFHSVFNIQNRTRQYFCRNYIDDACMYKFRQDSTRFFRPNMCYLF